MSSAVHDREAFSLSKGIRIKNNVLSRISLFSTTIGARHCAQSGGGRREQTGTQSLSILGSRKRDLF